jgi:hypothetical protein
MIRLNIVVEGHSEEKFVRAIPQKIFMSVPVESKPGASLVKIIAGV